MELTNLITDRTEVLAFSAERPEGVGYFPTSAERSTVSSLLLLSDASFLLTDKIGCRFEFDQGGRLTEMHYSPDQIEKIDYADRLLKAFDVEPYEVRPVPSDQDRIDFRGVSLPKRLLVQDMYGRSEQLTFGDDQDIVGYVPNDRGKSRFEILALLSNGSFQLRDKQGNEVKFGADGHFDGMILPTATQPISGFEMGRHRVVFRYSIDRLGHVITESAWISPNEAGSKPLYVVSYKYDDQGSLARAVLETPEGKEVLARSRGVGRRPEDALLHQALP
jgi:hypothetical protein